jgi:hypothetical protein
MPDSRQRAAQMNLEDVDHGDAEAEAEVPLPLLMAKSRHVSLRPCRGMPDPVSTLSPR